MRQIRFPLAGVVGAAAAALIAVSPAHAARHKKQHETAASKPAAAATETLGKSGAWSAYASGEKSGRVCYLVGQPQKSEAGGGRRAPMAMVTHRPAEKIANVVSFVEGYPLKDGSDLAVDVDGRKFELFTKDDSAWARTSELDRTIVAALEHGKQVVVKGVPAKGGATTDVYALAGFSKALALIDKACGIKRETSAAPAPEKPVHHRRHHSRHGHH